MIFASPLISFARAANAAVLSMPTVFSVATIWRLMLETLTVSLSITSIVPTPERTSASAQMPPTPPMPKTATFFVLRTSDEPSPNNISDLINLFSIFNPFCAVYKIAVIIKMFLLIDL